MIAPSGENCTNLNLSPCDTDVRSSLLGCVVAGTVVLSGAGSEGWIGTAAQLTISGCAVATHLWWIAEGAGTGLYYSGVHKSAPSTKQLLWSAVNEPKHNQPVVCTIHTLGAVAVGAVLSQNPILIAILLIEARFALPAELSGSKLWKPDAFWVAVLREQSKVGCNWCCSLTHPATVLGGG